MKMHKWIGEMLAGYIILEVVLPLSEIFHSGYYAAIFTVSLRGAQAFLLLLICGAVWQGASSLKGEQLVKMRKLALGVLLGLASFGGAFALGVYWEFAALVLVRAAQAVFIIFICFAVWLTLALAVIARDQLMDSLVHFMKKFFTFDFPAYRKAAAKIDEVSRSIGKEFNEMFSVITQTDQDLKKLPMNYFKGIREEIKNLRK